MKNIPKFKTIDGKWILGRRLVEELTNAVYADKEKINIDGTEVEIVFSERNDREWIVTIKVLQETVFEPVKK